MSRYNDELKLKLAWQTAYEQRTCPPSEILYSDTIDSDLQKHLAFCDSCRESREIAKEENNGFQGLFAKMASNKGTHESNALKQAGQIWTMHKSIGKWLEDGRYLSAPTVLLLSTSTDGSTWKVAQLYTDAKLMGAGDVWLGDQFGFAQAWNTYSIHHDVLECWLGNATEEQISEVISAGVRCHVPVDESSILSFFREMEVAVGLNAAKPLAVTKVAVSSQNESFLQSVFGTLAETYRNLSQLKLPEFADSLVDLLSGASDPYGITPVVAATSIPLQVNVVIKQQDGAITLKTVGATLSESNWEDGDYYVAGKLNETMPEDLFLVASLNFGGNVVCECQSSIEKGSPYFDILFKSVSREASAIHNLKFILVKP